MNLKEIKELVEFVAGQDLSEFEFERAGVRIRIRKGPEPVSPAPAPAAARPAAAPAPAQGEAAAAPAAGADLHVIKSPIVGTFYRSPSPDADPFVKPGDFVDKGAVLCIIEAMKLMNEIESDISGEIVTVMVESGNPVEYGQPLFGIRPRS